MGSFEEDENPQAQVHSRNYPSLATPVEVSDITSLRYGDPGLYESYEEVLAALRQEMLPADAAAALISAMNPSLQREVVNEIAGLDASVLMTLKNQLHLVDAVLRKVVSPDGVKQTSADEMGITPKEAINLSLKITQVITRDLPKIYRVDRLQRMEKALFEIVETELTKTQQDAVLKRLQALELEDAKRGEN